MIDCLIDCLSNSLSNSDSLSNAHNDMTPLLSADGEQHEASLSSKGREQTPAPLDSAEAIGNGPAVGEDQQEKRLYTEMESRLKLAPGTRAEGPDPPQQQDYAATVAGQQTGHAPGAPALAHTTGDPGEAQSSRSQPDMLDLIDQALVHERKGKLRGLKDDVYVALLEFSKGLQVLESAPPGEPSYKLRMLFREVEHQLLASRAYEYNTLVDKAKRLRGPNLKVTELEEPILRLQVRTCLRLLDMDPHWGMPYNMCSIAWCGLEKDTAAVALMLQGEGKCDQRDRLQTTRMDMMRSGEGNDALGSGGSARRKAAMAEALAEQEDWEASGAVKDVEWLQLFREDPASIRVLSHPVETDQVSSAMLAEAMPLYKLFLKERPYSDVLLLYSDPELVCPETDPAIASRDSHLCRLARASLSRGLYGELGPSGRPATASGRAKKGGAKKGAKSKKEAARGLQGDASSSSTHAPDSGPGESSQQRVLARDLELARRCNELGNREAAAGRLPEAAFWYSRGLVLAFPKGGTTDCPSLNNMHYATGPPGTKALALALLHNRSGVYRALGQVAANPALLHLLGPGGAYADLNVEAFTRKAALDPMWCAYFGSGWWRGVLCLAQALMPYDVVLSLECLEGEAASHGPGAGFLCSQATWIRREHRGDFGQVHLSGPKSKLLPMCQKLLKQEKRGLVECQNDLVWLPMWRPKSLSRLEQHARLARERGEL